MEIFRLTRGTLRTCSTLFFCLRTFYHDDEICSISTSYFLKNKHTKFSFIKIQIHRSFQLIVYSIKETLHSLFVFSTIVFYFTSKLCFVNFFPLFHNYRLIKALNYFVENFLLGTFTEKKYK